LRAAQLLSSFPTTAAEDEEVLGAGGLGGIMWEVVVYRLAKKRVLQRLIDYGDGGGGGKQ